MSISIAGRRGLWILAGLLALAGCERPPIDTAQNGYRGLAMGSVSNPRIAEQVAARNQLPPPVPEIPGDGPAARTQFKNLQVLGDLSVGEFTRTMLAITAWVSPKEGCNYCHVPNGDLASDDIYTKVVARKMLEMTRAVNTSWTTHVAQTGVTCYTCHRGQPVPPGVWFNAPARRQAGGFADQGAGQNLASYDTALTSMLIDPMTPYLEKPGQIRVVGKTALPQGYSTGIKDAEGTYSLMMHASQSLGVNCTFCHNSRSFIGWNESPPQRVTAWHGINMTRELNGKYVLPLAGKFPANRLGPTGDVGKVGCNTCHQGVNKPLYGAPMAKDHAKAMAFTPAVTTAALPAPAAPQN